MYSPSAVHLLHQLGIPLEWVMARNLQEHAEATHLETAECGADGRVHLLTPAAEYTHLFAIDPAVSRDKRSGN